ncbi:MAG: hypothetical protein GX825_02025 [Syntrophomonadaceae bacterium]|nr:hypothetical protein [Syntrophomonadaceae bacterium]
MPAVEQLVEGSEKRYFTWAPFEENIVLADNLDVDNGNEEDQENSSTLSKFPQKEVRLCLNCGKLTKYCNCQNRISSIPLFDIEQKIIKNRKGQQVEQLAPPPDLQECPRCRSKSKSETEIVTPITIHGTGPLANLTYELYRQLPTATDLKKKALPGEGRKLLTFYDSRQGAARFAAFLQDVSNKQNYRHLIPQAIDQCLQADEWGDNTAPNLFALSKKSGEIAWKKGIIQNDSESNYWRSTTASFTVDQRKSASIWMGKIILGEFTTGRRSRQSLESMGLVGVSYFQKGDQPDFSSLGKEIGLSTDQTSALIGHLLDDLRFRKAVKLPTGIFPDDPEFGTNKGNPHFIRQGKPRSGEERWIGDTPRQLRRQYVQRVLEINRMDFSDESVVKNPYSYLGLVKKYRWIAYRFFNRRLST